MSIARTLESIDATTEHIRLISRKRQQLAAAQRDAEDALLAAMGRLIRSTDDPDLAAATALEQFRGCDPLPGWTARWRAATGYGHSLQHIRLGRARHQPNGPAGSWQGEWPVGWGAYPPDGQSVVYVLFDAELRASYVGSSERFRSRLRQHHAAGKRFLSWAAYPASDREAAYDLEVRLLNERKPYLNKKVGR